jgi:hypothetical protein
MTQRIQGWTAVGIGVGLIILGGIFARQADMPAAYIVTKSQPWSIFVFPLIFLGIACFAGGCIKICAIERPVWLLIAGLVLGGILLSLVKPLLYGSLTIVHGNGAIVLLAWPFLALAAVALVLTGFVRWIWPPKSRS